MKIKEARDLSPEELVARKSELRKEAFQLRIQQGTGQLENPSQLTKIRKDVARIETVLSERNK
ncbi:MAG: 50S ribosomal protein L29 [Chthoniobacterales bacterium]